jgi:uncharacterized protein (TIGR02596 family)
MLERRSLGAAGGFTLVELITVLAILVLLAALSVPAVVSLQQSDNLSSAGQIVASQINLARQLAATTNRSVQVRLIQVPSLAPNGYCAIQIWNANLTGATGSGSTIAPTIGWTAVSRLAFLPQTAIAAYSSSANLSELLSAANIVTGQMPTGGATSNANYYAFQISPAGLVTPSLAISSSYLSIVPARNGSGASIPANYVSIQIDPQTATALVYRP